MGKPVIYELEATTGWRIVLDRLEACPRKLKAYAT